MQGSYLLFYVVAIDDLIPATGIGAEKPNAGNDRAR